MPLRIHDTSARVSQELSQVLEDFLVDADEPSPTLGAARDWIKQVGGEQSLYAELEALIEEFGEDAPAIDFIAAKASDELSALIESLLDRTEDLQGVTLGSVREAMVQGLMSDLEGEGRFEPEVEQPLLAEVDALIERYGPDTPAEYVLGFD